MSQIGGGLIPAGQQGDVINNPLQDGAGKITSHNQMLNKDLAPTVGRDLKTPPGWGVIIIGFGEEASERGLVTITHEDWVLRFPRNTRCAIPRGHLENLLNTVETRYMQPHDGAQMVAYQASRYNFQILKWPEDLLAQKAGEEIKAQAQELEVA